jgi:hypothetical protein
LQPGRRHIQAGDLAKKIGASEEYTAFYKLYSKLVHPSSWFVNSLSAVETPIYRQMLISNAQIYGRLILRAIENRFAIDADACYQGALDQMSAMRPS